MNLFSINPFHDMSKQHCKIPQLVLFTFKKPDLLNFQPEGSRTVTKPPFRFISQIHLNTFPPNLQTAKQNKQQRKITATPLPLARKVHHSLLPLRRAKHHKPSPSPPRRHLSLQNYCQSPRSRNPIPAPPTPSSLPSPPHPSLSIAASLLFPSEACFH